MTLADLSLRFASAILGSMADVTQILSQIEQGDPAAAEQLLPLVYDELRKLAAAKMAQEKPGQTLQATALVHDAYVRLVDGYGCDGTGSGIFLCGGRRRCAASSSTGASKGSRRHGGELRRVGFDTTEIVAPLPDEDVLALDEALDGTGRRRTAGAAAGQTALLRRPDPRAGRAQCSA